VPGSLGNLVEKFVEFHRQYSDFFKLKTKSVFEQSYHYLCGLMRANRKNMERMAEAVPNCNEQSLQHHISNSPWDDSGLIRQIGEDAEALIGDDPDTCLIVDESGFKKSGEKSVGVSRQWLGRLGKIDNGQVGVFVALNRQEKVTLIDTRLFLPESWTTSKKRLQQAGVPEERYRHRKKTELALEMIQSARDRKSSHQWVGADGFYGNDPWFLRQLDQMGETFMIDVHADQVVYLDDPQPLVPQRRSHRGRTPSRLTTEQQPLRVSDWAKQQPAEAWTLAVVRDSTKGKLKVWALHGRVWLWDGQEKQAHQWQLIVRRERDSKNTLKYSLSNAPVDTAIERLAFMQGQRFFVERAIEDGKSSCGMADYQVRGWTGWHHHMAMVLLAMLFMLKIKIQYDDTCELISSNDIRELLYHFLPKRAVTTEEVLRQMAIRHQKRRITILNHIKIET
jgi:SRSO17 transposase